MVSGATVGEFGCHIYVSVILCMGYPGKPLL